MHSFDFPWRVVSDLGISYELIGDGGRCLRAPARGDVRERPIVGDYVRVDEASSHVVAVAPRRSWIARANSNGERQFVAANLTAAFVVTSPEPREFSPRRIARYLVALHAGNVDPVVVLNKADADRDASAHVAALREAADGAPVLPVSARDGANCEALAAYLQRGATVALCGSSGVGKSTLLNRLAGQAHMATAEMRADGRGRHTTTVRRLIYLPSGAAVVDTPGMRSFMPWAAAEHVGEAFGDIALLAAQCRFADCEHAAEPGCAVRDGASPDRLEQWRKLRREAEWLASREDPAVAAERKSRWKQIHKAQRAELKRR